jgi:hypothetical protein
MSEKSTTEENDLINEFIKTYETTSSKDSKLIEPIISSFNSHFSFQMKNEENKTEKKEVLLLFLLQGKLTVEFTHTSSTLSLL